MAGRTRRGPEQLGTIVGNADGDVVRGVVPTEHHVDVGLARMAEVHRLDLASQSEKMLFASPTISMELLAGDDDVAYVNYEYPPFSNRDGALARIDGDSQATGAFGRSAPPEITATAVQLTADQVVAGVGLKYAEGNFAGVVTLPRTGTGGDLVFCVAAKRDASPRDAVEAIAVDGDTGYAALGTGEIVRFHH
ncbi:MAG TPA: hypothetical protein VN903_34415 [Polyangia bacterium]|jgi:hypothetical protein|nr:hypothetical protein [Polyangia bacterium]